MVRYQATYEIANTGRFYTSPYYATKNEAINDAFTSMARMFMELGIGWASLVNVDVIEVIVPEEGS